MINAAVVWWLIEANRIDDVACEELADAFQHANRSLDAWLELKKETTK